MPGSDPYEFARVTCQGSGSKGFIVLVGEPAVSMNSLMKLPQAKSDRTSVLPGKGRQGAPRAAEVPTGAVAALPGYAAGNWYGIFGPAHAFAATVWDSEAVIRRALRERQLAVQPERQGVGPTLNTSEEFTELVARGAREPTNPVKESEAAGT